MISRLEELYLSCCIGILLTRLIDILCSAHVRAFVIIRLPGTKLIRQLLYSMRLRIYNI